MDFTNFGSGCANLSVLSMDCVYILHFYAIYINKGVYVGFIGSRRSPIYPSWQITEKEGVYYVAVTPTQALRANI